MKLLKVGDRIRLKVRLTSGWKGIGTVTQDQRRPEDLVWFRKDGDDPDEWMSGKGCACRHEVAVCRKAKNA